MISKLYRMEPVYSGTHFTVNLSPDQDILSVFSRNYSKERIRYSEFLMEIEELNIYDVKSS